LRREVRASRRKRRSYNAVVEASARIESLRRQVGGPRDGALLRFTLARALRDAGDVAGALAEFEATLRFDPDYSAAWQAYGETLAAALRMDDARAAYLSGIACAERRGDTQAAKVMRVFLRRLEKRAEG
jgi:tetratricopeptide (TPR) repeat protein